MFYEKSSFGWNSLNTYLNNTSLRCVKIDFDYHLSDEKRNSKNVIYYHKEDDYELHEGLLASPSKFSVRNMEREFLKYVNEDKQVGLVVCAGGIDCLLDVFIELAEKYQWYLHLIYLGEWEGTEVDHKGLLRIIKNADQYDSICFLNRYGMIDYNEKLEDVIAQITAYEELVSEDIAKILLKAQKLHKIQQSHKVNLYNHQKEVYELIKLEENEIIRHKVLYLQQIGRGLRKTDRKKNVIVIDVVDEYGAMVKACNMHSIFANPYYVPFGDITKMDYKPGEMVIIDGMEERIERISEVDIDSFEDKYGNYLSQEQIAREYFVSTGTVISWIKKGKIIPSAEYKFGSRSIYLFSPDDVEKYRKELNIKEHNDNTIKQDFFDFLEERDYSLSYKMPFMLSFIKAVNTIGDADIEKVLDGYIGFYQNRIDRGLPVDRSTCPYNQKTLKDRKAISRNMLTNPFEKFERKRFLYYSKDLSVISMNHALYSQMTEEDWTRVKEQLTEDLKNYYAEMGGI